MVERLIDIQQRLTKLREDRSRFFTVANVLDLYSAFNDTLTAMSDAELSKLRPVISDCILGFSLAFGTVGFTRQPIAVYAKAVTLQILLEFILWDPSITPRELTALESSIASVESCFKEPDEDIPEIKYVNEQISAIVSQLRVRIEQIAKMISTLPEEEYPVYSQIIRLRRDILAEVCLGDFSAERMSSLDDKLTKVKTYADGGSLHGEQHSDKHVSDLCDFQLQKALILMEWFRNGVSVSELESEDNQLIPLFRNLREMLPILDVFVMTRRWTLRVTDLYQHMKTLLDMLPRMLIRDKSSGSYQGVFNSLSLDDAQKYHYLVTYMARRSWALIFKLLDASEPVSEALSSLYNQLLTMKRCLGEVQLAGGISNLRELYPYQLKLSSLDNLREDGKFVVDKEVPPGQGVLNGMLAECFDMMYELKVELDEKGEGDEGDESLLVDDDNEYDENSDSNNEQLRGGSNNDGFHSELDVSDKSMHSGHLRMQSEELYDDQLDDVPEAKE